MSSLELKHILRCHPIIKTDIVRGENTTLFDSTGREIVDFEAGTWSTSLGHSNPRINKIVATQANDLMNINHKLTNHLAESLALKLLELLRFKEGKAVFLSSGSEAVELSIRLSRLMSDRSKVLTFSTSYLSAFTSTKIPRDPNIWAEVDFRQCSGCTRNECTNGCSVLKEINFNDIASFALESASCSGVIFPPKQLVKFLVEEVKNAGGVIAANEITTGFGRTGEWFGYNHYNIEPDIVALGKSLGNGYPVSGVVMKKEVAEKVEKGSFLYAQSHQNDPLGCAVASEVIDILSEDGLTIRSKNIGEFFLSKLKELQISCPIVKDVRGRGLMLSVELKTPNITELILEEMLKRGYFIGTNPSWNVLRFFPALTIPEEDISCMCEELKNVLLQF